MVDQVQCQKYRSVLCTGRSTVGRLASGFGRPSVDWNPGSVDSVDWSPGSVDPRSTDSNRHESYNNFLLVLGWSSVDCRSTVGLECWFCLRKFLKFPRSWSGGRSTDVLIGRPSVDWLLDLLLKLQVFRYRSTASRLMLSSVDCRSTIGRPSANWSCYCRFSVDCRLVESTVEGSPVLEKLL